MTDPQHKLVFLSHSSKDGLLATELAQQIEIAVGPEIEVFASTRPSAIRSGEDWFNKIITQLEKSKILIVLLTPSARESMWIGFEFGYFWRRTSERKIHVLYHPTTTIPNPLNIIQGKLLTDEAQMKDFFAQLCGDLGKSPRGSVNVSTLVGIARSLVVPPPERTLKRFEELLDKAEWDYIPGFAGDRDRPVWICQDDVFFQITVSDRDDEFVEEWTKGFPDPKCFRYYVHLKIAGTIVVELSFIGLDGGRYFVPMPEIRMLEDGTRTFFWSRSSLRYKVGLLISRFYQPHESLETFAERRNIDIC